MLPSRVSTVTLTGMSLPLLSTASATLSASGPQQGTYILTTSMPLMSLLVPMAVSLS